MNFLSELFYECAFKGGYQQVGDSVNYKFIVKGKSLTIYFQGSNSITDWVRNFLFKKRPYKDMKIPYKVHRGFLAAWKEVEDIIIEKVTRKELDSPEYMYDDIIIVGYSHGGALAQLCHECVWYHRPDLRLFNLRTYAFEAPRMFGHYRVSDKLQERWEECVIIRTNNDIVTHCPPRIFKYCHVGTVFTFKGDISKAPDKWYIPKCVKSHYPEVVYDAILNKEKTLYQ
jgi:hypothetical protein